VDGIESENLILQSKKRYHICGSDRTWNCILKSELEQLRCKICFILFGCPAKNVDTDEELSGYIDEQKAKAIKICDKIVELSS
jgi:hypothetical protein